MPDLTVPIPPFPAPADDTLLFVEDQHFSTVPEWVIDADIPDHAFRVYALLLRYGNSSGIRMASRAKLAARLHRSADAVDRALRALEGGGLVVVERRRRGGANLPNRYYVRTSRPTPAAPLAVVEGGRTGAATPDVSGSAGAGLPEVIPASSSSCVAVGCRCGCATPKRTRPWSRCPGSHGPGRRTHHKVHRRAMSNSGKSCDVGALSGL